MNLTQIIEKAEGEFDEKIPIDDFIWEGAVQSEVDFHEKNRQKMKSFLSEKIKEGYRKGYEDGYTSRDLEVQELQNRLN